MTEMEHLASLDFVQRKFRDFYSAHSVSVTSVHKREFGFGFRKKIDFRHKSFASDAELNSFFKSDAPLYASYSTAYYDFPAARPMEKKIFRGSDLVFDIDLPFEGNAHVGHNPVLCLVCFSGVKRDALKLFSILTADFGFSEKEISMNFSGGKGFHFHLNSESVLQLKQDARRQLTDYLAGPEFPLDSEGKREEEKSFRGPSRNALGWGEKFFQFAFDFIERSSAEELRLKGFHLRKSAEEFFARKKDVLSLLEEGKWRFAPKTFWEALYQDFKRENAVGVDAMVTLDLARIIRIPNSLHGDTGFVAKKLSAESLKKFEVFDAMVFSNDQSQTVSVAPNASLSFDFAGKTISLKENEPIEVSVALGVLLLCKQKATLLLEEKKKEF